MKSALDNQLEDGVIRSRIEKAEEQLEVVNLKHEEYLALAYPIEEEVSTEDAMRYDTVTSNYDKLKSFYILSLQLQLRNNLLKLRSKFYKTKLLPEKIYKGNVNMKKICY